MSTLLAWHHLSIDDMLNRLAVSEDGLGATEAQERLNSYGKNTIPAGRPYSAIGRFIAQFNNVLIYILLASALITALMQHWTDAGVIATVILINALIGFIQEQKAENALAAIRDLLSPRALVLRDGEISTIDAASLVPGDVVTLTAGDKVPADLRLTEAYSLRTQEAMLTGESLDVEKNDQPVAPETPLGSRTCMAYSGTLVTAGQGKGVVVATGAETEIGRISTMIGQAESPQTKLTLKLARFSRWLAAVIVVVSLGVFFFGVYVRHLPVSEMFMVMIGIAVSAIPEGLPAVISITMALGVRAMAGRHAIVRHLPVIEALGSVTVICTDKTGTLTRNELAVTDIITAEKAFCVTGIGYAPDGKILFDAQEIALAEHPTVCDIGCAAMLNNDATLKQRKGVWEINGDPTEGALMAFAYKAGHELEALQQKLPRTDVIPFSAEQRYMATLHHNVEGNALIYIKGAPEQILSMCDSQQRADGTDEKLQLGYWQTQVSALAKQGKRVLAVAHRHASKTQDALRPEDIQEGLCLLGLFGIMDTPRPEARDAIAACLQGGIGVKMITGDHVMTASSIGELLGIPGSHQVMTGADIERMSDKALAQSVEDINIYARMHPEHKLRLVQALQARGAVVAMTGDGVNDAPALKRADIGIAMGKQGTEVAKVASDLVLVDDNFASIVHAVEEGRNIYQNIQRTIQFMLVTDGTEGLTLLIATLAGLTLPITPLQILWVNMVTAVTLSLAFAFAPGDPSVMRSPPVPPTMPLFSCRRIGTMFGHIALMAAGTIGLFLYEMHQTHDTALARTIAVNVLVFFQIYYLWGMFPLPRNLSGLIPVLIATVGVILFQLGFTYVPWMQGIFATTSLNLWDWLTIIIVSAAIYLWLGVERGFQGESGNG